MPSLLYTSILEDEARGNVDFDTDTFWAMLVTSTYSPNQATHTRRSDITNEVVGTGYTSGGKAVTVTVTKDTANKRADIQFSAVSWPTSTITARAAVYYKRRGGAASADEIVGYDDFGSDVTSTGGTFDVAASTYRKQLP